MGRPKKKRPYQHSQDNPFLETSVQRENGEYLARKKTLSVVRRQTKNERIVEDLRLSVPLSTANFFRERAAILGVGYVTLVKDVLSLYATLVTSAERRAGINYGQTAYNVDIPQRTPGYRELIVPAGSSSQHDTPLGLEEM